MEYGQIFHVMRIGKYYCKNMKYRINIYIFTLLNLVKCTVGTELIPYWKIISRILHIYTWRQINAHSVIVLDYESETIII